MEVSTMSLLAAVASVDQVHSVNHLLRCHQVDWNCVVFQ
jgi:hypothetical protein